MFRMIFVDVLAYRGDAELARRRRIREHGEHHAHVPAWVMQLPVAHPHVRRRSLAGYLDRGRREQPLGAISRADLPVPTSCRRFRRASPSWASTADRLRARALSASRSRTALRNAKRASGCARAAGARARACRRYSTTLFYFDDADRRCSCVRRRRSGRCSARLVDPHVIDGAVRDVRVDRGRARHVRAVMRERVSCAPTRSRLSSARRASSPTTLSEECADDRLVADSAADRRRLRCSALPRRCGRRRRKWIGVAVASRRSSRRRCGATMRLMSRCAGSRVRSPHRSTSVCERLALLARAAADARDGCALIAHARAAHARFRRADAAACKAR